ncbi:MAG: hypothetical protein P1U69_03195 [Parvibaculaceae bacterium]|nr:hypothetical protein [Parvibaculaceae bacterium]
MIKIKSVDGSAVRGEIWCGEAEVDFAGAEAVRTDSSKVYQSGIGFFSLVDSALNTHGMTINFAYLKSASEVPYLYLTYPTVVLMYGTDGGRFLPAPLEVGPGVGVNVFNDSGVNAVASMFYELH